MFCLSASLDPHQCTFRTDRSTQDAISTALRSLIAHLEIKNSFHQNAFCCFQLSIQHSLNMKLTGKLNTLEHNTAQLDIGLPKQADPRQF